MAVGVSGVIKHTLYNDYYIAKHGYSYVDIYYQEEYDVATNSSVITVTKITFAHSLYGGTWTVWGTVTIDGTAYSFGSTTMKNGGELINPIVSDPISHDSVTGEKTIVISTACNTHGGSGGTQFNASNHGTAVVTVPLTKIPRTSSLTTVGTTIGTQTNITINRGSDVFAHTLRYSFGSASGVIVTKATGTKVTWTPPISLCSQIPNAASGTCTIICETYNGSEYVGKTTSTMTLTVPESVKLSVQDGWAVAVPYNQGSAAASIDAFVQGYSKAQVRFDASKISAEGAYGASVASYGIVYKGTAISEPYCTSVLQNAGEDEVVCKVTDTRGRVISQTLKVTVQPYANPTLSGISVFRCESTGVEKDEGTYVSVTATGNISSIAGLNDVALHMQVGGVVSIQVPNGVTTILGDGNVLSTSTYQVILTATDSLGNTATYTQLLPTANVMFHGRKGGKGAAFGKYGEQDDLLDVDWNIRGRKNLQIDGALITANPVYPINLVVNGNFANPVNTKGETSYKGAVEGVNRWEMSNAARMVTLNDGYITVSDNPDSTSTAVGMLRQYITVDASLRGESVTLAAKVRGNDVRLNINNTSIGSYTKNNSDFSVVCQQGTIPENADEFYVALQFRNSPTVDCAWVRLYVGEYTEKTIPYYAPNSYEIENLNSNGALAYYPVGAVYISMNPTSPAQLFGGTWQQRTDRFLVAAGNAYEAGATGGSSSKTHQKSKTNCRHWSMSAWAM